MHGQLRDTTIDDWMLWHRQGFTWLPVGRWFPREAQPSSWSGILRNETVSACLESGPPGRFTYAVDRVERVVLGYEDRLEVLSPAGEELEIRVGSPLGQIERLRAERKAPRLTGWPAMTGGFVGAFGYDMVQTWERLPRKARRDFDLPLCALIEPRELFVYDGEASLLGIVVWTDVAGGAAEPLPRLFEAAAAAARAAHSRWRAFPREVAPTEPSSRPPAEVPGDSFSSEAFQHAVRRVQEYLAAGHTYQTNLSLRSSRATLASAVQLYEAVREVNPSPYMGLLQFPGFSLVCGSPELLVKLEGARVVSRPIAGTRPRGVNASADRGLSAELVANEKERAEHLMLVDLIRHDIGRVAAWGSVHVPEFMTVERYSHVMHLVSQVEGRLAAGQAWLDVFRAMFPGGTITGCPKIRTMEIIEELEPVGRGFYTGSLGWISYAGDMELNIIIRSMLVQNGVAHVQAGAGIVADSVPEREYREALQKARALWVAWERADARHRAPTTAVHS